MPTVLFHLAFPVDDMEAAKGFYVDKLGCRMGRRSPHSMILNLHGNQLVAQRVPERTPQPESIYPRHFGLIFLEHDRWQELLGQCRRQELTFFQEPRKRHEGAITEHETFFLQDPANNILEFKYYYHTEAIFGACHPDASVGDPQESLSTS